MSGAPGILQDVSEIVGDEAAEALAVQLGSRKIHVPHCANLGASHPLCEAMGAEAADQIAAHFFGETLYVPRARHWVAARMFARGMSTKEVAQALGVSASAARGYRKRS